MGLVPEFFVVLGICIFLALSLLSALLDPEIPSSVQYLFQGAGMTGLGLLLISQGLSNSNPANPTPFSIGVVYLGLAVSSVVGLNAFLALVRRKMALASIFSGSVTVPVFAVSAIFVSSFLGSEGQIGFTSATMVISAVSAFMIILSMFEFLRVGSSRLAGILGGRRSLSTGPVSVPLSMDGEEWEESPRKDEEEE